MVPPPAPQPAPDYEVDFLPVGDGSKSGDAIALRFGNLFDSRQEQTVVIIDGGFQVDGEALVTHVCKYYQTDAVDLVISTHPDQDHVSGLTVVLEKLAIGRLWMHKPWEHANAIHRAQQRDWQKGRDAAAMLKRALDDARELEKIANRRGIPIEEPFVGTTDSSGSLWVAGPTKEYYELLLPHFRGAPETSGPSLATMLARAYGIATTAVAGVLESWGLETLKDDGETSAETT